MKQYLNLQKINQAALSLAKISEKDRNYFLKHLEAELVRNKKNLLKANESDVLRVQKLNLPSSFIARLVLDERGLKKISLKLSDLQKLKSGIGRLMQIKTRSDDLKLEKIRVPIGVIFIIYEARLEVTVDAAALCIKSGNAVILKGGSEASETNLVLYRCILKALKKARIDKASVTIIADHNRRITDWLLKQDKYIDLVIARGGYGLVRKVLDQSKIPVLAHAAGGARIYIDKSADLIMAEKIIINAKTDMPASCNSLDTLIIHQAIAAEFIPRISFKLRQKGVAIVKNIWDTEFLDLKISIHTVKNIDEAVKFINHYTKGHSEGIIARDRKVADYFIKSVDAAALFINSSPRLHDGYEFGLGAEMGIATGKLHARGPVGLKELTTYKWIIEGDGHVRQ